MEPEVHLAEKWLQIVHKCMTATNVRAASNKEIDILAINPRKVARVHVECNCRAGHYLQLGKRYKHGNREYAEELEYFAKEKFDHPAVKRRIADYFKETKHTKTIIIWGIKPDDPSTLEYAFAKYGIEIRLIRDIIEELREELKTHARGSRDDIVRLLELGVVDEEIADRWHEKELREIRKSMKANKNVRNNNRPFVLTAGNKPTEARRR